MSGYDDCNSSWGTSSVNMISCGINRFGVCLSVFGVCWRVWRIFMDEKMRFDGIIVDVGFLIWKISYSVVVLRVGECY